MPDARVGSHARTAILTAAMLLIFLQIAPVARAQTTADGTTVQGNVRDARQNSLAAVSVVLTTKDGSYQRETKSDVDGHFAILNVPPGRYAITAYQTTPRDEIAIDIAVPGGNQTPLELVVGSANPAERAGAREPMQFSDNPDFAVAGVTDWTAVGGHGSDSTLRTSEDLARETATLKPQAGGQPADQEHGSHARASEAALRAAVTAAPGDFAANHRLGEHYLQAGEGHAAVPYLQAAYRINPADPGNAHDLALAYEQEGNLAQAQEIVRAALVHANTAAIHALAGELDERAGDPLAAVHEEETAVHLEPSEKNYYAWGSELLLHRAVWQAADVFRNGAKAYPTSARMLTALGTALFAGDLYEEAAAKLCQAADLDPADPAPYQFMGKMQMEAPSSLPCVQSRLARFAQQQPGNAEANYLYAMALLKQAQTPSLPQAEQLLQKAVAIDPKCSEAYLQLGILANGRHDPQKAVGYFTRAIAADPKSGEAHYRLGVAYDRMGASEKAKDEFRIHDEIEKVQADAIERQRRQVKQFLIVLQNQPNSTATP